jgi:hypothetical protein
MSILAWTAGMLTPQPLHYGYIPCRCKTLKTFYFEIIDENSPFMQKPCCLLHK